MPATRCPSCAAKLPDGFEFCGRCGARLDTPVTPADPPGDPRPATEVIGERREVTVLFADVIGFTAMCERLDPEEVHVVMNQCFAGLGRTVEPSGLGIDRGSFGCGEEDRLAADGKGAELQPLFHGSARGWRHSTAP